MYFFIFASCEPSKQQNIRNCWWIIIALLCDIKDILPIQTALDIIFLSPLHAHRSEDQFSYDNISLYTTDFKIKRKNW